MNTITLIAMAVAILLSLYIGGVIGWYLRDYLYSNVDEIVKLQNRIIRITKRMKYYKDLNGNL